MIDFNWKNIPFPSVILMLQDDTGKSIVYLKFFKVRQIVDMLQPG